MEYTVLENLVEIKLKNFIEEYKNTSKLFENTDVQNRLLHPGEYGIYKEKLISKLFEFTLPRKYSVGTGFIVNSQKEITKQCDIILYDALNAPFLEVDSGRFFPQEVVYAIGEVKSKMTKKEFLAALVKLAKNKQIRKPFDGISANYESVEVNPLTNQFDSICTFLICDEIVGFDDNILTEIDKEYICNNIEVPYRHNIIISLKNGVLLYDLKNIIELAKKNGHEVDKTLENGQTAIASSFFVADNNQRIVSLDYSMITDAESVEYLKDFVVLLNNFLRNMKSYYPEPTNYIFNKR